MYKLVLKKSIKYSFGRLTMIALAIMVGVVMTFGFVSGVNCLSATTPKWAEAQNYQSEQISYGIKANVDTTYVSTQYIYCGIAYEPSELCNAVENNTNIKIVYLLKTGDNVENIGSLKVPNTGEYYISRNLSNPSLFHELNSQNMQTKIGSKMNGIIPDQMLRSPDEMLIISGNYMQNDCMKILNKYLNGAQPTDANIQNAFSKMSKKDNGESEDAYCALAIEPVYTFNNYTIPQSQTISPQLFILNGFKVIGGFCIAFPILLFIAIASGLGAKQKESRYAALRLIGVTKSQITYLITLESLVGVIAGIILGSISFIPIKNVIASSFTINSQHFWPSVVDITLKQRVIIIFLLLLFSVIVNIRSMQKVNVTPLGVVRAQKLKKNPKIISLIPLILCAAGLIIIFIWSTSAKSPLSSSDMFLFFIFLFIVSLFAILISGPYLTFLFAKLISNSNNPLVLLASKRIMHSPNLTFRSVSGVVIAMITGGFLLTIDDISRSIIGDNQIIDELIGLVKIGLALTVIITIASLVISTVSGLLDRKDSLTTLYLSGVTLRQLRSLVVMQSLAPMLATIFVSSGFGALSGMTAWAITQSESVTAAAATIKGPGIMFFTTVIIVSIVATLAICAVLPMLKSIVSIEENRHE